MPQVSAEPKPFSGGGGAWAELQVRNSDPDNHYAVRFDDSADTVTVYKILRGKRTTLGTGSFTGTPSVLGVGVVGATLRAWTDGTLRVTVTDGDLASGGAALAAEKAYFEDLKVVYDANTDGVVDVGKDVVVNEDFGGNTITPTYDNNGNLTYDGTYKYTYDAWPLTRQSGRGELFVCPFIRTSFAAPTARCTMVPHVTSPRDCAITTRGSCALHGDSDP
jgi:hypothetical protein